MSNTVTLIVTAAVAAAWILGWVLYSAWRSPERACWACRGSGVVLGCTPILRRLVRGTCWLCSGRGWRMRRLSRWLGWDRNARSTIRW